MRSRILLYALVELSALAFLLYWLSYARDSQELIQTFPATVNRDCAPWDGAAFTVSIPYDPDSVIDISIWQSPDIRGPIWFSFPDRTMRARNALLLLDEGLTEELTGTVGLQHVGQEVPLEGEFDLTAETGKQFKGKFVASWGNEIVYCG